MRPSSSAVRHFPSCLMRYSNYLGADYGINGEGEQALCSLIEALNEGRSVPAITGNGAAFQSGETMTCRPLWDPELIGYYLTKDRHDKHADKTGMSP